MSHVSFRVLQNRRILLFFCVPCSASGTDFTDTGMHYCARAPGLTPARFSPSPLTPASGTAYSVLHLVVVYDWHIITNRIARFPSPKSFAF
eukprot:6157812-Pleurochrysis_carterae.AAC.4